MPSEWITLDAFEQQTGIRKDDAQRKCRSNEWPQGTAWMYYSEKIRLINIEWWNKRWHEMARVYAKQQKAALKSNSSIEVYDAANASNVDQLMRTLEK